MSFPVTMYAQQLVNSSSGSPTYCHYSEMKPQVLTAVSLLMC